MSRKYRVRYKVEVGAYDPPADRRKVRADVSVSPDDHGYADDLIVLSVAREKKGVGPLASCLFMGTWEGQALDPAAIPREVMQLVRDQADHYLAHHCPPEGS